MRPRLGSRLRRRPSTPGLLACGALLACLAVASLVLALHGSFGGAVPGAARTLSAQATLSSRSVLFGDTVQARLAVILPSGTGLRRLRLHPSFRPFRIVSRNVEREDLGGGLERISLRYGLRCLSLHCLSGRAFTHVQFSPTPVSISGRHVRAVWPPLVQVSRLVDVSAPLADNLDSGPPVSPRLEPRSDAYEALGAAGASLAILLAGWLYLRRRARRRRVGSVRPAAVLEAILERVEAGLPEDVLYRQRHALDALAVELRQRRIDGSLAVEAERLAWAPEQPDADEIRDLCARVRGMVTA